MNKDERQYTVYKHTAPNGKVYIGITGGNVLRRWQGGRNYKNNPHFNSAINKYGWKNIKHEILFTELTKEEAERKEIELIAQYKSNCGKFGYNIENGGNATGKLSEETKAKISAANKGKKYKPRRKHTEAEKQAIREKLKGRPSPMKNKHWSEEQKARVGCHIVCIDTGKHYYSIRQAAQDTGANRANIARVLKGEYKQTGGLHFEYDQQSV